jgi:hypothetical protein
MVFRVYFLIYIICFRLEGLLRKTSSYRVLQKVLIYKINTRGELLLGGDLIHTIVREALIGYKYFLI